MDKYRATLVAKAAQDIAADMTKEAGRAEFEISKHFAKRELHDNIRIAKALVKRDPDSRQRRQ